MPECGHAKREVMPTDACRFFYECKRCRTVLRPRAVTAGGFCSYDSVKCTAKRGAAGPLLESRCLMERQPCTGNSSPPSGEPRSVSSRFGLIVGLHGDQHRSGDQLGPRSSLLIISTRASSFPTIMIFLPSLVSMT